MTVPSPGERQRLRARVPARVEVSTRLRAVARAMVETKMDAVLVDSQSSTCLVTARDLIEAIAAGADPDVVWAGDVMRPIPRVIDREQHPTVVGEEMAAYELEFVAVVDEHERVGLASALDVLEAITRALREP